MVNNGHTIQVNVPSGSILTRGGRTYEMVQYHFHHPSEHFVDDKPFAMEAHFVHKVLASDELGVLGVFLVPGAANSAFARLASTFPAEEGVEVAVDEVDARELVPDPLGYWFYEGSLTTPPCSEGVTWYVMKHPVTLSEAQFALFAKLYPEDARPIQATNHREILATK